VYIKLIHVQTSLTTVFY